MNVPPLPLDPPPRRVLVRGVNWLGDAVMTTPALLRLREQFPETHLALLTSEKLRDLWRHHPAVDDIIAFRAGEGVFSVAGKLRAGNFDLALVLPNSPRSALEAWLARIPRRVGYARPWRNWCLTQAIPPRPGHAPMRKRPAREIRRLIGSPDVAAVHAPRITRHEHAHHVHEYLHLAAALGANPAPVAPTLVVRPEEVAAVKTRFGLDHIGNPILGLNPGAEYGPAKRWPAARFIAAAREIQRRTHCAWLIFGGETETALAGQIAASLHDSHRAVRDLSGKTSLRELMALLKACRVLLTNDTGPMHVAAALGTPVVAPFGSTSPELTGPGLPGDARHRILKSDALCAPCFRRRCPIDLRCMEGISVEPVVRAVLNALAV